MSSIVTTRYRYRVLLVFAALLVSALVLPADVFAHNVSKRDAAFVVANQGRAVAAFLYLGAKHMVTGYDHLLFLVGVIFFLYKLKDVALYVSLFTIGHSLTLLLGVLALPSVRSPLADAPMSRPARILEHDAIRMVLVGVLAEKLRRCRDETVRVHVDGFHAAALDDDFAALDRRLRRARA